VKDTGGVVPPFVYDALPGRVVFGPGTARTLLAGEAARLGVTRILLIAGDSAGPVAQDLGRLLGDRLAAVFTGVRPHVPAVVAEAARAAAAAAGADALLSIGGGSATGTAKAVALTTGLPVIAVPTTYAGSEVTPVWGLTEGERKRTGTDLRVLPRVVLYDPELSTGLPPGLSAASGLNAMAHCVEAFWAPHRNPVTSLAAEEGIRALAGALPLIRDAPRDLDLRGRLLYGAYLAGAAFAVAGSGLHHKICHVLGGRYNLPHAELHAIVLPHVLAYNTPGARDAAVRIGRALAAARDGARSAAPGHGADGAAGAAGADAVEGAEGATGSGGAAGADGAAGALRDLADELEIPAGLRDLGLRAGQIAEAAELIAPAVPPDNPVPADAAALRGLLRAAWAGKRPAGPGHQVEDEP
jgi:maleylacetate reductase